jgi:hypothetical protein
MRVTNVTNVSCSRGNHRCVSITRGLSRDGADSLPGYGFSDDRRNPLPRYAGAVGGIYPCRYTVETYGVYTGMSGSMIATTTTAIPNPGQVSTTTLDGLGRVSTVVGRGTG